MDSDFSLIALVALIIIAIIVIVIKKRNTRYHGAGEGADSRLMQEFGTPARTLYTSSKFFTLHHHIDITDEKENVVYTSQ